MARPRTSALAALALAPALAAGVLLPAGSSSAQQASATTSPTPHVDPTATATSTPTPHVDPTPTATATATATATPTPTSHGDPPPVRLEITPSTITAGERSTVEVLAARGSTVVLLAYTRPSTTLREVARRTADQQGRVDFSVAPTANTRVVAQVVDGNAATGVLTVRPRLSIAARTNGGCWNVSGGVFPAAAGRSLRLDLARAGGSSTTAYRAVDARGRWEVRGCGEPDALVVSGTVTPRNAVSWPSHSASAAVKGKAIVFDDGGDEPPS